MVDPPGRGSGQAWPVAAPASGGTIRRLLLTLVLLLTLALACWPRPAWGVEALASGADAGGVLFENHCAGCHVNGGNIIRRSKTLRQAALERNGITGPEAVAAIAAAGIGQMGGYAEQLGPGGPEAVGTWVWERALADWRRREPTPPS